MRLGRGGGVLSWMSVVLAATVLPVSGEAQSRLRDVASKELTVAFSLGGEADTTLLSASRPTITPWGFVVADLRGGTVSAFDFSGQHLWRVGGRGHGPLEFIQIVGLVPSADGSLLIVDTGNRKVNRVSAKGVLSSPSPFDADIPLLFSAGAGDNGTILATTLDAKTSAVGISSTGHLLTRHPVPFPGIDTLSRLLSGTWVLRQETAQGSQLLFAFPLIEQVIVVSPRTFAVERTFPVGAGKIAKIHVAKHDNTIETSMDQPYVPVPNVYAGDGLLYVLTKNSGTGLATSHVEVYDVTRGALVRRIELPSEITDLAVGHGMLIGVRSHDVPLVIAWRLPDK